ncbi:MAG: hypothetical protein COW15_14720, partial [Shewanella sp. CG12_big_fil_rev_8_21_14_0_65_47_15]
YAVKVARTVLRETALGNKCRPPDNLVLEPNLVPSLQIRFLTNMSVYSHREDAQFFIAYR